MTTAPSRRMQLIIATGAVWALALCFAAAGRVRLAARAPTNIALTTWPPSVRVTIDGGKHFGGDYVVTPVSLTLSPGRHKLTLSRDGYFTQSSDIDDVTGRTYDMSNVVLQRDGALSFVPVEIETFDGQPPVGFSIDAGFSAGETPALVDDLLADVPHVLTLFATGQDPKTSTYRCRFSAPFVEPGMPPYKIRIKAQGTGYKVTGCQKLRAKR